MAGCYNGDPEVKDGHQQGVDFSLHGPPFAIGEVGYRWNYRKDAPALPGFVEAALLRASIYVRLGKYAEASKEFNYLVSIHPRSVTFARVLSDRAWFQTTCPNSSFRNGQQAIRDAKAACSIMSWKDEDMIDTLAAAYAEAGDFDSAVRYAAQALAVKGISSEDAKVFGEHLAWFQQRKPIPVSQ